MLLSFCAWSQSELEILQLKVSQSTNDSLKVVALNDLEWYCTQHMYVFKPIYTFFKRVFRLIILGKLKDCMYPNFDDDGNAFIRLMVT
jgi:hypothetical protein